MAKLDIVLSADFLQETPDLEISGNLDFSFFSQISAGELRSYFPGNLEIIPSWQNYILFSVRRSYSRPQIFPEKPISRSLKI